MFSNKIFVEDTVHLLVERRVIAVQDVASAAHSTESAWQVPEKT